MRDRTGRRQRKGEREKCETRDEREEREDTLIENKASESRRKDMKH